jgi:large subunit ribosomal protein L24
MASLKIKKGDKIVVLSGKDKGKTGIVERAFVKTGKVLITGLNIVKKHTKANKDNPAGGLVEISRPLTASKVQVICPSCNKPARISYLQKGKTKERVCKRCGKAIHVQTKEVKEK